MVITSTQQNEPFLRIFMSEFTKVTDIEIEVWTCMTYSPVLKRQVTAGYVVQNGDSQKKKQKKKRERSDCGKVAACRAYNFIAVKGLQ